jgi:hypothetical protein
MPAPSNQILNEGGNGTEGSAFRTDSTERGGDGDTHGDAVQHIVQLIGHLQVEGTRSANDSAAAMNDRATRLNQDSQ